MGGWSDLAGVFIIGPQLDEQSSIFLENSCAHVTIVPPVFAKSHPRWISENMNGNISLGLGEAGCLLAHELVWQQISKRPDNEGYLFLVLEDDARITRFGEQNFQRILSSTNEISLDLVNLGKEIFRVDPTSKSTQKGLKLLVAPVAKTLANTMPPIFLADFDWRTRAYLISRNLASELVKHPLSFQKPVDQFLRETSQKSGFKARFKAMTLAQTVFGDSGRASLVDNLGRARDKRG